MLFQVLRRTLVATVSAIGIACGGAIVISFPWNTDPEVDESTAGAHPSYYQNAYSAGTASKGLSIKSDVVPLSEKEQFYVDSARHAAKVQRIPERLATFVEKYDLKDKKSLEVGAGSGMLQDIVEDYTALDISASARRFFHKPFVEASATEMPFQANTFDALWSIWVLEHIPNPEKALAEIRRVVKPGGYIYLLPAYEVDPYAAQGHRVRPYSDFDWEGKLVKATIPIFDSRIYHYLQSHQIRLLRFIGARLSGGPTRFHFARLTPNYDQYWIADSDATTSFTYYELYLWFSSRGDLILESAPESRLILRNHLKLAPLIIQVRK